VLWIRPFANPFSGMRLRLGSWIPPGLHHEHVLPNLLLLPLLLLGGLLLLDPLLHLLSRLCFVRDSLVGASVARLAVGSRRQAYFA